MRRMLPSVAAALALVLFVGCASTGPNGWWHATPLREPGEPSAEGEALARYLAAVMYDRAGESALAVEQLKAAAELDPEAVTPTLRLVRAYLKKQDYDAALESTDRAIEQLPNQANLYVLRGEIYHQLKRYDDAVEAFQKAIELNPTNLIGYGALVELQENTNDLVAAIDVYRRLIEMTPNTAGLHYQLGLNLARIKDADGAIQALEKALELEPRLARARFILGSLYLERNDNEKSAAMLEEYLKKRPEDVKAMETLAGALARMGQYPAAKELFAKILASEHPTAQHSLEAAYLMLLSGAPAMAEKLVPPSGAPYFSTLMTALARQAAGAPYRPLLESLDTIEGELDEECNASLNDLLYLYGDQAAGGWLLEHLAKFRQEVPSKTLGILQGRTLMSLKRFEEAAAVFEGLLTQFPPDRWVHYYLGMCCEELDRFEDTEKNLKAYLLFDPENAEVINFLGYLYADKGVKLDEAEILLKKALQIEPENPFYLDSLGWVYYKQGRADEAIDHIQRAIYGMESDDAVLREHLGDAYLLKGDIDRAISEWERARRLDPKLEGVQEKIDQHRKP